MYTIYQVKQARFNDLWVEDPLVALVKQGTKRVYFGDEIYEIPEGGMAILPNNVEFHNENIPNANGMYEAHTLNIEKEIFQNANHQFNAKFLSKPVPLKIDNGLKELSAAFYNIFRKSDEVNYIPIDIVNLRKKELVLWLANNNYFLEINSNKNIKSEVFAIINGDIEFDWNLEIIADKMGMGISNLRRKLNEEGTGFQKILTEARMMHALGMIQTTNKSITEIAFCVGYSSVSRFSERFKERFGVSPKTLSLHGTNIIKG